MSKQTNFIAKVAPGAQAAMKSRGILASLTIAQAIVESGWGQHTYGANNLFGIKANGWSGRTVLINTREQNTDGSYRFESDLFRAYDTWAESIEDHAAFLVKNSRYKNLIGVTNYKSVCICIKADGYATEQDYAQQLISIIEQYKLYKYDSRPTLPALLTVDEVNGKTIRGWALNGAGLERVDLYIDKNIGIGSSHEFTARPDVQKAYPNYKTALCGFSFDVADKIGRGRHTVKIAAIGKDKSVKWAVKNIKIF